jgi:hypothetical protein
LLCSGAALLEESYGEYDQRYLCKAIEGGVADYVAPDGARILEGWFFYKDAAPDGAGIWAGVGFSTKMARLRRWWAAIVAGASGGVRGAMRSAVSLESD